MTDEEINRRDALAFRAMMGETLTRDEAANLADLNARLATWLPKPAPLPGDVRDALDSVHGILARMSNVCLSRIIATAIASPMPSAFLASIRATGTTRNASGFIVDAGGTVRSCFVNSSGNWDLTTALTIGIPIDATTFSDLRASPAGYSRVFVLVTHANGSKSGICVAVDPPDPVDPG